MNYRPILAVLAALSAAAVVAIVTPRYSESGEVSWLVVGVVTALVGALALFLTRQNTDAS